MPPIPHCWAAGGWTGLYTARPAPGLLEECRGLGGCRTGEARLTGGYALCANHVIHTVGPVWHGGRKNEPELLRLCYWNSLELAREHNLKSIAFPCISTGVYGYPAEAAAHIAVRTVLSFLDRNKFDIEVTFCVFSRPDLDIYKLELERKP